jgi:hypothetical protein
MHGSCLFLVCAINMRDVNFLLWMIQLLELICIKVIFSYPSSLYCAFKYCIHNLATSVLPRTFRFRFCYIKLCRHHYNNYSSLCSPLVVLLVLFCWLISKLSYSKGFGPSLSVVRVEGTRTNGSQTRRSLISGRCVVASWSVNKVVLLSRIHIFKCWIISIQQKQ